MEFADFLFLLYLLGTSGTLIYVCVMTSRLKECMLIMDSKIRKMTDDIRHISMVTERTSATVASLNTHKMNLADIEQDVAKLKEAAKKVEPKKEAPYVRIKN